MKLLKHLKIRLQKIRMAQLEKASETHLKNLETLNSSSKEDDIFMFI